jgi:hypothetical protein
MEDKNLKLFVRLLNRRHSRVWRRALMEVARRHVAAIGDGSPRSPFVPASMSPESWERFARSYQLGKSAAAMFIGQAFQIDKSFKPQVVPRPRESVPTLPSPWPIEQLQKNISPRIFLCTQCYRYFLAARAGRRCFCSPACAGKASALKFVPKKRAATKAENLRRAAAAICSWDGTSDWKVWTAARARLTRNFITAAVNRGELKAPR